MRKKAQKLIFFFLYLPLYSTEREICAVPLLSIGIACDTDGKIFNNRAHPRVRIMWILFLHLINWIFTLWTQQQSGGYSHTTKLANKWQQKCIFEIKSGRKILERIFMCLCDGESESSAIDVKRSHNADFSHSEDV